jgi:hypothetical protein
MNEGVRFNLCLIAGVLLSIAIALTIIAGIAREQVDINRQMLELSRQQYEDNQAITARMMEKLDADPPMTDPPPTLSREEAYEILKEGIREEAVRKGLEP